MLGDERLSMKERERLYPGNGHTNCSERLEGHAQFKIFHVAAGVCTKLPRPPPLARIGMVQIRTAVTRAVRDRAMLTCEIVREVELGVEVAPAVDDCRDFRTVVLLDFGDGAAVSLLRVEPYAGRVRRIERKGKAGCGLGAGSLQYARTAGAETFTGDWQAQQPRGLAMTKQRNASARPNVRQPHTSGCFLRPQNRRSGGQRPTKPASHG